MGTIPPGEPVSERHESQQVTQEEAQVDVEQAGPSNAGEK